MACGVYCFHRSVRGRFSGFGFAISSSTGRSKTLTTAWEEYAGVDDNANLALSDLKVDWDGFACHQP